MENVNGIGSTLNAEAINQPAQDFSYVEIPPQDSEASLLALDASFTSLKRLERKKDRTDSRMARVEQKANKIITSLGNQVGFILSYSGAWILYQHLQLAVVGWITFVSIFCLIGGLGVVIWAARMELRRMIPSVQSLDSKRKALAQEAQKIYNLESKRTKFRYRRISLFLHRGFSHHFLEKIVSELSRSRDRASKYQWINLSLFNIIIERIKRNRRFSQTATIHSERDPLSLSPTSL